MTRTRNSCFLVMSSQRRLRSLMRCDCPLSHCRLTRLTYLVTNGSKEVRVWKEAMLLNPRETDGRVAMALKSDRTITLMMRKITSAGTMSKEEDAKAQRAR